MLLESINSFDVVSFTRFSGTLQTESQHAMIDVKDKDILTPAMDVFSVG